MAAGLVGDRTLGITILSRHGKRDAYPLAFSLAKKVEFENNRSISNWKEEK